MQKPLPPGQKETLLFPRFGVLKFARRFPSAPAQRDLTLMGEVRHESLVSNALHGLPRVEQTSNFHCVTTWSHRGLRWGGVRFADFYAQVVLAQAQPLPGATTVILHGQDGARTSLLLDDLLAPEVLIADQLNAKPLGVDHGAPWRLVAPAHYGYKSIKHLSKIEFRFDDRSFKPSAWRFMDHPRARVALEERGRGVPGALLRYLYRPLVAPTAAQFARALRRYPPEHP